MSAPRTAVVTLSAPLTVDGKTVKELTLREPTGGDLRGVMLATLLAGSVEAHCKLVPRIATPAVSPAQVDGLSYADHVAIMTALQGFLGAGGMSFDAAMAAIG